MTSAFMTLIGIIGATTAGALGTLPDDSPLWLNMTLTAITAVISAYLGKTNKGTK